MEDSGRDGDEMGWPTLTKSLKVASMVVPPPSRIVYWDGGLEGVSVGEAEDWIRSDKTTSEEQKLYPTVIYDYPVVIFYTE